MDKIEKLSKYQVKQDLFSSFLYTCGVKINYFTHFESYERRKLRDLIVNQFKMVIIEKGACSIDFSTGESFELKAGDICIIPPMTLHNGKAIELPLSNYEIFFEFKPIAKEKELISLIALAHPCVVSDFYDDLYKILLPIIYQEVNDGKNASYINLLNFVCQVLANRYFNIEDIDSSKYNAREVQIFRATYAYLEDHYHEAISVSDLCNALAISQSYLFRAINNIAHISPSAFIHKYKMIQAEKLLKGTNISIENIAIELGYSNIYYFSTTFKKTFGISPSNYRKSSFDLL